MLPTVLFVDDNPAILQGFRRSLRNQPFQLLTAPSAENAMDLLKRGGVDVIVSDESMKGMKGTELLCWVAEHYPGTARLMLTGQPSVPSMQTAINQAGVFRYLVKPIQEMDLAMAIHDALDSASSGSESSV